MQLSNDVKWNKIQEIISLLEAYDNSRWSLYRDIIKPYIFENVEKLARRDTWILANKLYDIATDGLEDSEEIDDYAVKPITKQSVIDNVIKISSYITTDEWKLITRYCLWEQYDYNNS